MATITLARRLGQRWSRVMDVQTAALYLGHYDRNAVDGNPELAALAFDLDGRRVLDRNDLDAYVDQKKRDARA